MRPSFDLIGSVSVKVKFLGGYHVICPTQVPWDEQLKTFTLQPATSTILAIYVIGITSQAV